MAKYKSVEAEALSPLEMRAVVNKLLLSKVGSGFAAGTPEQGHMSDLWRVPIFFAPPDCVVGEVGEAQVDSMTGEVQQHTPVVEMQNRATELHGHHKTQVRAAFLRARKA